MQPLDKSVALWPTHLSRAVLDLLQLEEQLMRMMVHAAAEFSTVVAENCADPGIV